MKDVDRNNVMDLRTPRWEHLVLQDDYFLMIINMSEKPMRFTVSGPERPPPESERPDPEFVPVDPETKPEKPEPEEPEPDVPD